MAPLSTTVGAVVMATCVAVVPGFVPPPLVVSVSESGVVVPPALNDTVNNPIVLSDKSVNVATPLTIGTVVVPLSDEGELETEAVTEPLSMG